MQVTRRRRKPMGEMNVVPYIDVMLVLLVIFMITAPLLTQGVKVELPKIDSEAVEQVPEEPLVITVDRDGVSYLTTGIGEPHPLTPEEIAAKVKAHRQVTPKAPVYLRGDQDARYGTVVRVMDQLQKAGLEGIGLLTETPEDAKAQ